MENKVKTLNYLLGLSRTLISDSDAIKVIERLNHVGIEISTDCMVFVQKVDFSNDLDVIDLRGPKLMYIPNKSQVLCVAYYEIERRCYTDLLINLQNVLYTDDNFRMIKL